LTAETFDSDADFQNARKENRELTTGGSFRAFLERSTEINLPQNDQIIRARLRIYSPHRTFLLSKAGDLDDTRFLHKAGGGECGGLAC
jgi:hypothetical protein